MAWFLVDDTLHSHPKARRAGAAALGVWVAAGSFSMGYKTDGFVPQWWLDSWGKTGLTAARKLVEAHLWSPAVKDGENGWQFHDWNDIQMSADDIERGREMARNRQRKRRAAKRAERDSDLAPTLQAD